MKQVGNAVDACRKSCVPVYMNCVRALIYLNWRQSCGPSASIESNKPDTAIKQDKRKINHHAIIWGTWRRLKRVKTESVLSSLSRSPSNRRRAEIWPTESVPSDTWNARLKRRMASGRFSRWPPGRRCKPEGARRAINASCCNGQNAPPLTWVYFYSFNWIGSASDESLCQYLMLLFRHHSNVSKS